MKLQEIRELAQRRGIEVNKMKKRLISSEPSKKTRGTMGASCLKGFLCAIKRDVPLKDCTK